MSQSSYHDYFSFPSAIASGVLTSEPEPAAASCRATIRLPEARKSSFATFVCHFAFLERKLRDQGTLFVDYYADRLRNRSRLGKGVSFSVERADWQPDYRHIASAPTLLKRAKAVAVKTVIPLQYTDKSDRDWSNILLEIRALLHPLLRYHPNIVTLLGLGWGSTADSDQVFPQLLLEFASHGTLHSLQASRRPLLFPVKQKLCHDVAKGLSVLHACGIVHGDVKSENVLVFDNTAINAGSQPYIAKVADFGGSVFDGDRQCSPGILTYTPQFAAPEVQSALGTADLKQADVYSFGLLACRTFLDGDLSTIHSGFTGDDVATTGALSAMKSEGTLLPEAMKRIPENASRHRMPDKFLDLLVFVCQTTLDYQPTARSLPRAQAALRGVEITAIDGFLRGISEDNQAWSDAEAKQPKGKHGVHVDSVGTELGKLGGYYDPQRNMPGYRPQLDAPADVDFLFEPEKLRNVLGWTQQEHMLEDFKIAAEKHQPSLSGDFRPSEAAFYLFRCHLADFGTKFDAKQACEWLWRAGKEAAAGGGDGGVDYLAGAWAWRISDALNAVPEDLYQHIPNMLGWAILRGHVTAQEDGAKLIQRLTNPDKKKIIADKVEAAVYLAHRMTGALGSACFMPHRMLQSFTFHEIPTFERQLQEKLGDLYEQCLKPVGDGTRSRSTTDASAIDMVIVNDRGHGILHAAANMGAVEAVRYLATTYLVNIDLLNQDCEETPLLCACRGGHLQTALFLLESGANPNGHPDSQETPLHWLRSFEEDAMETIATALVRAGANIEAPSGTMRADLRQVHADWEGLFSVPVTPLGRAVILRSLPAAKVLLKLGANALTQVQGASAVDLAALLTLPDYLQLLLDSLEGTAQSTHNVIDECELLQAAHDRRNLGTDTLSLLSRLVRHGDEYQNSMVHTCRILRDRRRRLLPEGPTLGGETLCREVQLGNIHAVESLLKIGHDPNGSYFRRPLAQAACLNHVEIVDLLLRFGAEFEQYPEISGTTFLQLVADRPRTARPGLQVARRVLDANVSVVATSEVSRPALQAAVLRHHFDLADLLSEHHADINAVYFVQANGIWVTILWELFQSHTKDSLLSLRYILRKQTDPASRSSQATNLSTGVSLHNTQGKSELDFIVDRSNCLSAFHVLAACPQEALNFEDTTSLQICQLSLSYFGKPERVDFVHPVLGTALCQAVLSRNKMMIGLLLDMKANPNLYAIPAFFPHQLVSASGISKSYGKAKSNPLWLAIACYAGCLEQIQPGTPQIIERTTRLRDHDWIIQRLLAACEQDTEAVTAHEKLQSLQQNLESTWNKQLEDVAISSQSSTPSVAQQLPVDLSAEDVFPVPEGTNAQRERIIELRRLLEIMIKNNCFGNTSSAELQQMRNDEQRTTNNE